MDVGGGSEALLLVELVGAAGPLLVEDDGGSTELLLELVEDGELLLVGDDGGSLETLLVELDGDAGSLLVELELEAA